MDEASKVMVQHIPGNCLRVYSAGAAQAPAGIGAMAERGWPAEVPLDFFSAAFQWQPVGRFTEEFPWWRTHKRSSCSLSIYAKRGIRPVLRLKREVPRSFGAAMIFRRFAVLLPASPAIQYPLAVRPGAAYRVWPQRCSWRGCQRAEVEALHCLLATAPGSRSGWQLHPVLAAKHWRAELQLC